MEMGGELLAILDRTVIVRINRAITWGYSPQIVDVTSKRSFFNKRGLAPFTRILLLKIIARISSNRAYLLNCFRLIRYEKLNTFCTE
jgi:hypothetical protein